MFFLKYILGSKSVHAFVSYRTDTTDTLPQMTDSTACTALYGRYLKCLQGSSTATKCNGLTRMVEICTLLCADSGRRCGKCTQYTLAMPLGHSRRQEVDYDIHETQW